MKLYNYFLYSALKGLPVHGIQEFRVGLGRSGLIQEKLHRIHHVEGSEQLAYDPTPLEHIVGQEELFATGAALVDVDAGEDALFHELAVQVNFAVTRALELFEDDLVHAAARVDQGGRADGQGV